MTSCVAGSTNCHFTCPNGGTWFVCETAPYFVGCCSSDPCGNTTTPACPDLYPASFEPSVYHNITPNSCVDSAASNWYTCNFTSPPFIGCCSSNPCSDGCPSDDLLPAAWSISRPEQYALFLDNADPDSTDSSSSSGLSSGAIAGIAIGAAAAVILILAALFLLRRRRKRRQSFAAGFTGDYAYHNPASPYQDSHMGSPAPTAKYLSGSSTGNTFQSSPPLGSESHRPTSEIGSASDDNPRSSYGLNIYGAHTGLPAISELQSEHASPSGQSEIHELDGLSR